MGSESINERAKYIFTENYGNRELMRDNNYLEEYENYFISRETEIMWKNEFISDQFSKADAKLINISELISSVCIIIKSFSEVPDFEKLIDIHKKYLAQEDLFIQSGYFNKAYEALIVLVECNSNISYEVKLDLINKLSCILSETIRKKDSLPNRIYKAMTTRYGLECRENCVDKRLEKVNDNLILLSEYLSKNSTFL